MNAETKNFRNYVDFWPYYLSQHSKRGTRRAHIAGTLLGLAALLVTIVIRNPLWILMALALGYGFAWMAHSHIEENQPATFAHPLWSLRGDFHMLWLWLGGRLETELVRHKIVT